MGQLSTLFIFNKSLCISWVNKLAYFLHTHLELNQELAGKVASQNDSHASTSGNQSSSKQSSTSAAAGGGATRSGTMPGMDLPIFTEEFLEHNKSKYRNVITVVCTISFCLVQYILLSLPAKKY